MTWHYVQLTWKAVKIRWRGAGANLARGIQGEVWYLSEGYLRWGVNMGEKDHEISREKIS